PEEVKKNKEVEKPAAKAEPADDVIRARSETLSGPKVVGKIQLPVSKPHKPVASSSNNAGGNQHDNKRKRKRTNKPNTGHGQGHQGQGQHGQNQGQAGQGQGQGHGQQHGNRQDGGNRPPFQGGNRPNRGNHPNNDRHGNNRGRNDRNRKPDTPKEEPTEKEIQDQIKATLARLSGAGKSGKFAQRAKLRRQKRDDIALSAEEAAMEEAAMSKVLRVTEF